MGSAQTAVTAPAGVAVYYESFERNDEMREAMKVADRKKKLRNYIYRLISKRQKEKGFFQGEQM